MKVNWFRPSAKVGRDENRDALKGGVPFIVQQTNTRRKTMKKSKFLIFALSIIFTVFSFLNSVFAEERHITDKVGIEWSMVGSFSKPDIVLSGQRIFSHCGSHKNFLSFTCLEYKFIGQTGDKTFEIDMNTVTSEKERREVLKMYFTESGLFPLTWFHSVYPGCTKDDKIYLKMIKLQAGQLEYQIIAPNCITK